MHDPEIGIAPWWKLSIRIVCGSTLASTRSAPRDSPPGLPARIVLRSRSGQALSGRVLRVEPMADAVTEEMLAKVIFGSQPSHRFTKHQRLRQLGSGAD